MTFKHLLTCVALLLIASLARAQNGPSPKEKLFEFRITAWNFDLPGLFFEQNGQEQQTALIERNTSRSFTCASTTGTLELYTKTMVDDTVVKTSICKVTLAPPPGKNLVLLWHEKSGRYGSSVLADDPQTPPPGHLRLINLTDQSIAVQCKDREPFTLAPGKDRIIPPTGALGVAMKIARQRKRAGSWQLALMRGIAIAPNERITAFVADPERLSLSAREASLGDTGDAESLSFFTIRDIVAE